MDQQNHIKTIEFSFLTDDEKLSIAAREISCSNINDKSGYYNDDGPMSFYLGSSSSYIRCKTCNKSKGCLGHFGVVKLNTFVYNPLFFLKLKKILRAVCFWCSRDLLNEKQKLELSQCKSKEESFTCLSKCSSFKKTCSRCNGPQPIIQYKGNDVCFEFENKEMDEADIQYLDSFGGVYTTQKVFEILRDIDVEFEEMLNFKKKKIHAAFLMQTILVSPSTMRTSFMLNKKERQVDQTKQLQSIINFNLDIIKYKDDPKKLKRSKINLQKIINEYLIKDYSKSSTTTSTPSICMGLQGKGGIIRRNLLGKRSGNNARLVIGGDPLLDIDTICIPKKLAQTLTIPIKVNILNFEACKKMIEIGSGNLNGASLLKKEKSEHQTISLNQSKEQKQKIISELQHGDVLYRHLRNKDYLLMNRAPTLSKQSIFGFKVKISNDNSLTLKFNPLVCSTFNADYDGDEMTLNCPQDILATAELKHLCNIRYNLVDRSKGKCTVQTVQDLCSACYCLTLPNSYIDSNTLTQLYMMIRYNTRHNKQALLKKYLMQVPIKGFKVLDLLFPDNFCCKNGKQWLIKNGCTQEVTISKQEIQCIFKELCSQYSPKTSVECISDFSRMMTKYLSDYRGLSISLDDISLIQPIQDKFQQKIQHVCKLVEDHSLDPQQKIIGLSACNNIFERNIKHTSFLKKTSNSLSIMISSGAKGKISNLQQLTTCIGQQIVNSEFPDAQTCFKKTDKSVKTSGFISSSYAKGVTSSEQFYLALGGRDGLIDTSLKTAETGYKQRKSQKAMEDIVCAYLMNGKTGIFSRNICLSINPGYKPGFLKTIKLSFDLTFLSKKTQMYKQLLELQGYVQEAYHRCNFQNIYKPNQQEAVIVQLPMDFDFFVTKFFSKYTQKANNKSMNEQTRYNNMSLAYLKVNAFLQKDANIYLKYYLTTKVLRFVSMQGLPDGFLENLFEYYSVQNFKSSFQCGDPVGNLTGGFTCRDSTQSTLNSFHSAGKKLVSGIKRARQLAEKQTSIKTFVFIQERQQKTVEEMESFSKKCCQRFLIDVFEEICSDSVSEAASALINILFEEKVVSLKSSKDAEEHQQNFKKFKLKNATLINHFSKKQILLDIQNQGFISFFNENDELVIMKDKKKKIKDLYLGCRGIYSCELQNAGGVYYYFFEVQDLSNLMHLDLDFNTLWCTNPFQIEKYFGCLMATQSMIYELCENSKNVDPRWNRFIALLMFQTGQSLPITSHGMLKAYNEVDTISAAAFERPRIVLSNAAFFEGTASTTCSSTASILSVPQYNTGTSSVDLLDSDINYVKTVKLSESTSSRSFLFMNLVNEFLNFTETTKKKITNDKPPHSISVSVDVLNEELSRNNKLLRKSYVTKAKTTKRKLNDMNNTLKNELFFESKKKAFDFNQNAIHNFFDTASVHDHTKGFNFKMPKLFS